MSEKPSQFNPSPEYRKVIKQHDKDNYPDQRSDTAKAIRAERLLRDNANLELEEINQKLLNSQQSIEHLSIERSEAERRVELLGIELSQREASLVKKAADLLRPGLIKNLAQDHRNTELKKQELTQELIDLQQQYQQLEQQYQILQADKLHFTQQQWQHFDDHYFATRNDYFEKKAEQDLIDLEVYKTEYGGLQEQGQENNSYFVHTTTTTTGSWVNNRLLRDDILTTWVGKAACVMVKKPHISASSISPEAEEARTLGHFGLVLNRGIIELASPRDAATQPTADLSRPVSSSSSKNIGEYQSALEATITMGRRKRTYDEYERNNPILPRNELVISKPEAVGVYVKVPILIESLQSASNLSAYHIPSNTLIRSQETVTNSRFEEFEVPDITLESIFKGASQLDIPVFGFFERSSTAYELRLDRDAQNVHIIQSVSPQEMANRQPDQHITEEMIELSDILIIPELVA